MNGKLPAALLFVGFSLAGLGAGLGLQLWLKPYPVDPSPAIGASAEIIGQPRPAFALPDLLGATRSVDEWDSQVLVVNFWATWCSPCTREIPGFIKLQQRHRSRGLQFIGVALDQPEPVRAYSESMGINYPLLLGAVGLMQRYGNPSAALPYTAIIDRRGKVVYTRLGELSAAETQAVIKPLL